MAIYAHPRRDFSLGMSPTCIPWPISENISGMHADRDLEASIDHRHSDGVF